MRSRSSVGLERKIEHTLFLVSVWSKGIAGLIKTIGGLLLLVIPQAALNAFVIFLTAPELAEDPTDRVTNLLRRLIRELGADTKLFAGAYLIVHGVIKVFLVAGLLRRRLCHTQSRFGSCWASSSIKRTASFSLIRSG